MFHLIKQCSENHFSHLHQPKDEKFNRPNKWKNYTLHFVLVSIFYMYANCVCGIRLFKQTYSICDTEASEYNQQNVITNCVFVKMLAISKDILCRIENAVNASEFNASIKNENAAPIINVCTNEKVD